MASAKGDRTVENAARVRDDTGQESDAVRVSVRCLAATDA
jgi:hypothetical protein